MNITKKDKFITVVSWLVIILSAIALIIFILWHSVYKVETKKLSIINYYNFPVEISFLHIKDNLEPFEIKVFDITTRNDFSMLTKSQDGTELGNIKITGLKLPEQIIEVVLSEAKDYCYFNADITSLYNPDNDHISQINVLSKNPADYFVFAINQNSINLYPGKNLPKIEEFHSEIIKGFYPIKCSLSQDSKEIEKVVQIFIDYNHNEQLEYLDQIKEQIQNIESIDQLNAI